MVFFHLPLFALGLVAAATYFHYAEQLDQRITGVQRTVSFASRMRVHSEAMISSLLMVERGLRTSQPLAEPLYALQIEADRFNQIIYTFNEGGEVVEPDLGRFTLLAVEEPQALAVLQELNVVWIDLKSRSDLVIRRESQRKLDATIVRDAIDFSLGQNERVKKLTSDFSAALEAAQQSAILAESQWRNLALSLATLALVLIPTVWLLNRARWARDIAARTAEDLQRHQAALEERQRQLDNARHESDLIMETVQEGLLLVDAQGLIGPQYSRELTTILRQPELAGANLLHLLQRLLTEKMHATVVDYFGLLFDVRKKERQVLKVNPLADVEVNFPDPAGGFATRFLGFNFRRIVQEGQVTRVFVAVRDITAQMEMERKLRESEKHKERQMEMLLGIVHVEPDALDQFAKLVEAELVAINQTLRAEDFAADTPQRKAALRECLNHVFRSVHNIKGNAVYLRLEYFQKSAEEFEARLSELQSRPLLTGDDFLAIVVAQAGLRGDLTDLQELRGKLTGLRAHSARAAGSAPAAAPALSPAEKIIASVRELAEEIATQQGKEVQVEADPFALQALTADQRELARDVLIQLVRNALAHSVELPAERERTGKPRRARLTLRALARTDENLIGFAFRDDGRGLDLPKIRRHAEAQHLVAPQSVLAPEEVARLIFTPGFSTAETSDAVAGRGMGLDIIKHKLVDEAEGAISVRSHPGKFCEFACFLPETVGTTAS